MRRIAFMAPGLALGFAVAGAAVGAQTKDVDLDATMKKVGPAFAALRKSIEGMDANLARENTAILRTAFADAAYRMKPGN